MATRAFTCVSVALGATIVLVGVQLFASQRSRLVVKPGAAPDAVQDDAAGEMRALRAELRELKQTLGMVAASCSSRSTDVSGLEPAKRPSVRRSAGEESAAATDGESLATAFEAEPRDEAWAKGARAALLETARKWRTVGTSVGEAECRSMTCRVVATHDTASLQESFMVGMSQNLNPGTPNVAAVSGRDGAAFTTTLYLSREGSAP